MGLKDRTFPEFDRTAIHQSVARRYGKPAENLPERQVYRPPSLEALWDALAGMVEQARSEARKSASRLPAGGDERALRSPSRVRKYIVEPGDTFEKIAESEMGDAAETGMLKAHNLGVGLIFEDMRLYAGNSIEIPVYDKVTPSPFWR